MTDFRKIICDEIKLMIAQEKKHDLHFNNDNYTILIGYKVATYLISDIIHYLGNFGSSKTLFGIRCEVDYSSPYTVDLLKIAVSTDFHSLFTSII